MKVLHVIARVNLGGTARWLETLTAEQMAAGQEVVVSARPSDAIAVAIRLGAIPILVDEELFAKVAIELGDVDVDSSDDASVDPEDEVRRFLDFL